MDQGVLLTMWLGVLEGKRTLCDNLQEEIEALGDDELGIDAVRGGEQQPEGGVQLQEDDGSGGGVRRNLES